MKEHAWVLVIDDDVSARTVLPIAIRRASSKCLVEAAFDGPSGVRKALHSDYALIFCKDHMPGFGCAEVVYRILEKKPAVPIYVTTDDEGHKRVKEALDAGARGVLHQPLDESEVRQIIETELGNG